jgi:hypothetical protein
MSLLGKIETMPSSKQANSLESMQEIYRFRVSETAWFMAWQPAP